MQSQFHLSLIKVVQPQLITRSESCLSLRAVCQPRLWLVKVRHRRTGSYGSRRAPLCTNRIVFYNDVVSAQFSSSECCFLCYGIELQNVVLTLKLIEKVYSLEDTDISKVFFTLHHVGHCSTNSTKKDGSIVR